MAKQIGQQNISIQAAKTKVAKAANKGALEPVKKVAAKEEKADTFTKGETAKALFDTSQGKFNSNAGQVDYQRKIASYMANADHMNSLKKAHGMETGKLNESQQEILDGYKQRGVQAQLSEDGTIAIKTAQGWMKGKAG